MTNSIPRQSIIKLIWAILILIILNYLITSIFGNDRVFNLDGTIATSSEINRGRIMGSIVGIPILGFILGWLVALIPYKKVKYLKKYIAASLVAIIGIHGLYFIMSIIGLIIR